MESDAVAVQRVLRSMALMVLITLALGIVLATVGCGGSGSSTSTSQPTTGVPSVVPACVDGTVATYLSTSCTQSSSLGTTGYNWSSYACTSTPSSICAGLGPSGSNVQMKMDPSGPYTILVGNTSLWNVTAGQSVDVIISGSVYGAVNNQNWPHFNGLRGQTGDGTEENITRVGCNTNAGCLNSLDGVSDILCDAATTNLANCTDSSNGITPYAAFQAKFNVATNASPYSLTIEIKLNGGTSGTATLYSVGTHLRPAD